MKVKITFLILNIALGLAACGGGKKNSTKQEQTTKTATEQKESTNKEQKEEATQQSKETDAVVIAKSGLAMRSKPDVSAKIVTVLPANAVVTNITKDKEETIKSKKNFWYKVQYGKYNGFVFGAYLRMGHKMEATNTAKANTASVAEDDNKIRTNFNDALQKALVSAKSGLVMRKNPSRDAQKIVNIPKNAEVAVLEYTDKFETINDIGGNWCKVRYGKNEGYIFSAYLNFSTASISAKSGLVLRKEPARNAPKITVIPNSAEVYLLNNDNFVPISVTNQEGELWYKVRYASFEGWASAQYMNLLNDEGAVY